MMMAAFLVTCADRVMEVTPLSVPNIPAIISAVATCPAPSRWADRVAPGPDTASTRAPASAISGAVNAARLSAPPGSANAEHRPCAANPMSATVTVLRSPREKASASKSGTGRRGQRPASQWASGPVGNRPPVQAHQQAVLGGQPVYLPRQQVPRPAGLAKMLLRLPVRRSHPIHESSRPCRGRVAQGSAWDPPAHDPSRLSGVSRLRRF
jgi:hypothetical protein